MNYLKHFFRISIILVLLVFLTACDDDEGNPENDNDQSLVYQSETLTGGMNGYLDGDVSVAQFKHPNAITVDSNNNIYVADLFEDKIRKISPQGIVSTMAGVGQIPGHQDGPANEATFNNLNGITVDIQGNLYVTDSNVIRKITPSGFVTTIAGEGFTIGFADGLGTSARFDNPTGIVIDSQDNLFICDSENQRIRKITPEGMVTTFAGNNNPGNLDGNGINAQFDRPSAITIDQNDNLYVTDVRNNNIRKITPSGQVSTIAGGYIEGDGTFTRFITPLAIAIDNDLNLFVGERDRIVKITPGGNTSSIIGSDSTGDSIDGIGEDASFFAIDDLAIDSEGNFYVAEGFAHKIRKVSPVENQ